MYLGLSDDPFQSVSSTVAVHPKGTMKGNLSSRSEKGRFCLNKHMLVCWVECLSACQATRKAIVTTVDFSLWLEVGRWEEEQSSRPIRSCRTRIRCSHKTHIFQSHYFYLLTLSVWGRGRDPFHTAVFVDSWWNCNCTMTAERVEKSDGTAGFLLLLPDVIASRPAPQHSKSHYLQWDF